MLYKISIEKCLYQNLKKRVQLGIEPKSPKVVFCVLFCVPCIIVFHVLLRVLLRVLCAVLCAVLCGVLPVVYQCLKVWLLAE